jgi:hypothetical protein
LSKRRPKENHQERVMANALDTRTLMDDIAKEILPILARAIKERWTPEQVRKHPLVSVLLAARQASIAITDPDSSKALAAIKDLNDRTEGKAVERVEATHKYEKLKDEELDALLASEEASLERDTEKH